VRGILVCLSFREELGVARNGSSGVPDDDVARGAESQRNPSLPGRAGLQGRHQVRCAGRSRVHSGRFVASAVVDEAVSASQADSTMPAESLSMYFKVAPSSTLSDSKFGQT
jgi:hypothetical protein